MANFNVSRILGGLIASPNQGRNLSLQAASTVGSSLNSSVVGSTQAPEQPSYVFNNQLLGKNRIFNTQVRGLVSSTLLVPCDSNCSIMKRYQRCVQQSSLNGRNVDPENPFSTLQPFGTWALSSFSHSNAARIQPVLEVEKLIENLDGYIDIIKQRNLQSKVDLSILPGLYNEAKNLKVKKEEAERARAENAAKVQELLKSVDKTTANAQAKKFRDKGKELREDLRKITNEFNAVNDNLVNLVLSVPNQLDSMTPLNKYEILRDFDVKEGVEKFKLPDDFRWELVRGSGPYAEYTIGPAAILELDLAAKCQKILLSDGFSETGNVDFVKRILLDGTGLDPTQFLEVREQNAIKSRKKHAVYLVGGATFPAFLALFAQSVIHDSSSLPIKYFVVGRCYKNKSVLEGLRQNTAVQVFVACANEEQQDEEFLKLAHLMEQFYSEVLGVAAQCRLLAAPQLRSYEKKKIAFLSTDTNKTLGDLTTVGDYVSKRLLCCYNDKRIPKFLHLITGQFFNITDFLRPMLPSPPQREIQQTSSKVDLVKPERSNTSRMTPKPTPLSSAIESENSAPGNKSSTSD